MRHLVFESHIILDRVLMPYAWDISQSRLGLFSFLRRGCAKGAGPQRATLETFLCSRP